MYLKSKNELSLQYVELLNIFVEVNSCTRKIFDCNLYLVDRQDACYKLIKELNKFIELLDSLVGDLTECDLKYSNNIFSEISNLKNFYRTVYAYCYKFDILKSEENHELINKVKTYIEEYLFMTEYILYNINAIIYLS